MAVIGKIQKNSVLLLVVIGLAMLAFIFTDLLRNGGGDIEQMSTAELYGEGIDEEKYEELRDSYVSRAQGEAAFQQQEFTDAARKSAEDNAFNELIRRSLLEAEFEKLGIVCTTDELNDMIHGDHLHPWVLQIPIFNGPAGFSRDSVRNYINRLEVEPEGATDEARANWLESRQQWRDFERELKDARKADKYVSLIKKGMFVNKLEAADQYKSQNTKKSVQYVLQRYTEIPQEGIVASEEEIKSYYEAHKMDDLYDQEEARDVEMVTFDIVPTEADKNEIKSRIEGLKASFKATLNDLGFVYQNTDSDFKSDSTIFRMGTGEQMGFSAQGGSYPKSADDVIQESSIGDVIGPYETATGEFAIAKIVDTLTESQAWVRHILISSGATRTEDKAKVLADSLVRVIKSQDNFAELVPLFSEDPGSVDNGGEYKWFNEGVMVPEFNDASFNGPIGQIQLVKTTFGYHIVEVLGKERRLTPTLAVVAKKIKPSENTVRLAEEVAYDFIYSVSENSEDSAFYSVAEDSGRFVQSARVYLSNDFVIGLDKSERMLRFAFNTNTVEGDLSDPIIDGNKYVVARISNVINEGMPDFEDVRDLMAVPALKEKQAQLYIEKMTGKTSLQDVANVLTTPEVKSAEVTFGSTTIAPGGLQEPGVIGKLFTDIPVGAMTKPIQGEEGVYVFIVNNETPVLITFRHIQNLLE